MKNPITHVAAIAAALALSLPTSSAPGEEEFLYHATLDRLALDEETWNITSGGFPLNLFTDPDMRIVLEGEGEAYLARTGDTGGVFPRDTSELSLAVRASGPGPVVGEILVPQHGQGPRSFRFVLGSEYRGEGAREEFLRTKAAYYENRLRFDRAGAAWFRHQARLARAALADEDEDAEPELGEPRPLVPARPHELEDSYSLFSGGRAISENIQLDRLLQVGEEGERTVDVESIPGIDVAEYDWKERTAGLQPELDPLSAWVPVDQHAVFFPSFEGLVAVLDEARRYGTPILRFADPRAEDARALERTERQLCLEMDDFARLLGPVAVQSVALTGSDPYLRTGSDLALVFECKQPAMLVAHVTGRQLQALEVEGGAAEQSGTDLPGVSAPEGEPVLWHAVRTPDRRVSSYVLSEENVVIVANSLEQMARVVGARRGTVPALETAPEYVYFRNLYPRGVEGESAFLMLTDATIRRWAGPRWRIGAARRTRAAAILAEHQAANARELVEKSESEIEPRVLVSADEAGDLGEVVLGPRGARSAVYGDLAFLTPILELAIDRVSEQEHQAYLGFRRRYQRSWREWFDPIAARLEITPGRVALDLTVMPLIGGTDYRELVQLTRGAKLPPDAGDPHPEAALHLAMALSKENPLFRQSAGMATALIPGADDPLGWIGDSVSLYFDQSEFWQQMAAAEDSDDWAEDHLFSAPIAAHLSVANPLGLVGFLTALRAFSDQAAPGMAVWENREHQGRPYVRVAPSPEFAASDEDLQHLALHYVTLPGGLTLSLDETVIQRTIDRYNSAAAGEDVTGRAYPWGGESVAVHAGSGALDLLRAIWVAGDFMNEMQQRSWGNLAVLDEWRALFPDRDPVEVHERLWFTRPVCPGSQGYAWNDEKRWTQSVAYGSPLAPLEGPDLPEAVRGMQSADFGLTFEEGGLRARMVLERALNR